MIDVRVRGRETGKEAQVLERSSVSVRKSCEHLRDAAVDVEANTPGGCEDCLAEGSTWVHLRLCLDCGHVGCCDSSPRRHASAHFRATGHPVVRSGEPDEDWRWCFVDKLLG